MVGNITNPISKGEADVTKLAKGMPCVWLIYPMHPNTANPAMKETKKSPRVTMIIALPILMEESAWRE